MTTSPLAGEPAPLPDAGAQLLATVAAALPELCALIDHAEELGPETTRALETTLMAARDRLGRKALHVVVVGEQKSGKSTFLNALLGARVLGTAARECTATVTELRWAASFDYEARWLNGDVRRFSEEVPDRSARFEGTLTDLHTVRDELERCRAPLPELPPCLEEEPPMSPAMQEALVDAHRALAGASADLEAANEAVPPAYRGNGRWFERLVSWPAWRRATFAIESEKVRHSEASRSVCQAQRYLVERRIAALKQIALEAAEARHARYLAEVAELTDHAGQGRDVAELRLAYPGKHLPPELVLIDTPGVNTDDALHRERAWRVIREQADGCWLVSDIQQALSRSTRDFIQELRPHVAHAFLVLTKVDRALENALGVGGDDPEVQVEEARRLAVKRFARELDRAPREVFAVAVAAEQALKDDTSVLGTAFTKSVETLVALTHRERAIALGARAAQAVRDGARAIERVGETARAGYEGRLVQLAAQRIPQPAAFQLEQMAIVRPQLHDAMQPLVTSVVREAKVALARQQMAWQVALMKAFDEDELKQTAARAGSAEPLVLEEILTDGFTRLRAGGAALLAPLEGLAFQALRERYRVAQSLTGATNAVVPAPAALEGPVALELAAGLDEALGNFESDRVQVGLGGAAAGAAIGSLVMPGVGTLVGALVGSLAAFFVSLDALKADCVKQLDARVAAAEPQIEKALEAAGMAIEAALADTLSRGLGQALSHYEGWIEEQLGAQREAIERLQGRLADLQARREALRIHEVHIEAAMHAAEQASRGLARSPSEEAAPGATVRLNLPRHRRGTGSL